MRNKVLSTVSRYLRFMSRIRWPSGVAGRGRLSPWIWLLPALVLIGTFLVYPLVDTIRVSFMSADTKAFVGMDNYKYVFTDKGSQDALLNNLLWLSLFTLLVVAMGLLFAVFTGRVRYESAAKAVIFIPMAISFVAAAIIWKFMYAYRPEGFNQIGLVNELTTKVGLQPTAWLVQQKIVYTNHLLPTPLHTNNFALILVGVWMWTGFAMVILSAGLKGISREVLEAARADGANEWQIFRRIILPILSPTIAVVAVTLIIQALKKFDLVWVMTSGNYDTHVVATLMYKQMFNFQDFGKAAALAVVLLLFLLPFMLVSLRHFKAQEEGR